MSTLRERIEGRLKQWRIYVWEKESNGEFAERTKQHIAEIEAELAAALAAEGQGAPMYNDPNDPDSELVIDDLPPHKSITVGELRKRAAAPSLHKEGLLETLFRIPFKEIEGIKWVRQLEVVRELRLCDESKLKPGFVNSAVNSTSVQDGQDVRILPAEDTTLSPLLPSDEWESLSSESRMKLRKWFDLAAKYLQRILDEPTALDKEGEPPTILKRVKLYLDSWAAYPAKELGEQPTAYVHSLLRELYEAAASPAGRAERVSGATSPAKDGETP